MQNILLLRFINVLIGFLLRWSLGHDERGGGLTFSQFSEFIVLDFDLGHFVKKLELYLGDQKINVQYTCTYNIYHNFKFDTIE